MSLTELLLDRNLDRGSKTKVQLHQPLVSQGVAGFVIDGKLLVE